MKLSGFRIRELGIMDPHVSRKTCRGCGHEFPETSEFFYRHKAGRNGLNSRCKPCINAENKAQHQRRLAENPERVRALASAATMRHYRKDLEKSRARHRAAAAKARQDEKKREVINMRKRGGGAKFTPEMFDQMLVSQGGKCAFCLTEDPQSRGKKGALAQGWNIDHCHSSGSVRFILCGPCNRGLAHFREDAAAMRRAADLIEGRKP